MQEKKRHFNHLSFEKRQELERMLKAKLPIKQIALSLGVHNTTIYREMKRGECVQRNPDWTYRTEYAPELAETKYRDNLKEKGVPLKIGNDHKLANYIESRIVDDGLTVREVLGEIKQKRISFSTSISVNTLYTYIETGLFLRLSLKHLPFRGKRRKAKRKEKKQKKLYTRKLSIEKRPAEVAERNTFGHWEMDCVIGKRERGQVLLNLTERLTRKVVLFLLPNRKTESVVKCLNILERKYGQRFYDIFKTITVDNGSEFADCKGMETSRYGKKKRTQVYYCHPYSSCERGTNERLNREIRRKFPKGMDLSGVTPEQVKQAETWINDLPKGIFKYDTSSNLFNHHISNIK